MSIEQLSVFVENNRGSLAEVVEVLGREQINLRALSIADTKDFGILRLIVDDTKRAMEVLKENRIIVSITEVLAVAIPDTPGSLAKILRILANAGISVEYIYAFITKKQDNAFVAIRVEDNEKASMLLHAEGIQLVEDISGEFD